MFQQSLQTQSKSMENSFFQESQLLQERESLSEQRRRFYQEKANFEEERRNFTEAAIQLGKEVDFFIPSDEKQLFFLVCEHIDFYLNVLCRITYLKAWNMFCMCCIFLFKSTNSLVIYFSVASDSLLVDFSPLIYIVCNLYIKGKYGIFRRSRWRKRKHVC